MQRGKTGCEARSYSLSAVGWSLHATLSRSMSSRLRSALGQEDVRGVEIAVGEPGLRGCSGVMAGEGSDQSVGHGYGGLGCSSIVSVQLRRRCFSS